MKEINAKKGLVSCIIPAYNTGRYIYECLESVKHQNYKPIEVIIVDDGSTDNTIAEVEHFFDNNKNCFEMVQIIKHSNNRGLCAAINTGLNAVHGEFTMWFDSDDLLDENNVRNKIEYLHKFPDIGCVMAEADCFGDKKILDCILGRKKVIGNWFDSFLLGFCDMSAGLNMVHTNELLKVLPKEGLRTDIKEQNWYMMMLLASNTKIGKLDEILYHYRVRDDSDSHKKVVKSGRDFKEFWDSVDRQRFYAINDCRLAYIYKCRAFKMQALNSYADRITTIDAEQIENDIRYVEFVVKSFLKEADIDTNLNNRKVYIWGSSDNQRRLKKVFNNVIEIAGFINSSVAEAARDVICGKDIKKDTMYIICTLQYHKDIIEQLDWAGFVNRRDYFYPKADLYYSAQNHVYEDIQ